MSGGGLFTAVERRAIAAALEQAGESACPACGTMLSQQIVPPTREVSYVRHRIWVLCPGCRRSASVDVKPS